MSKLTAVNGQHAKPTNPKDAVGINKIPMFSYIPRAVIAQLGLALMEGGHKYGRHNYREAGVRASIYMDATDRHLSAFWEGEMFDPDSAAKLNHIVKAIASLVVLADGIVQGNWVDDRPPVSAVNWSELHAETRKLNEQYPDPVPSWTQKRVDEEREHRAETEVLRREQVRVSYPYPLFGGPR